MTGYAVKADGSFRAVDDKSWCAKDETYQKDQPPITQPVADVERMRRLAYADPDTGSDRYFAEALSLIGEGSALDSPGVKELFAQGLEIKRQIKDTYQ